MEETDDVERSGSFIFEDLYKSIGIHVSMSGYMRSFGCIYLHRNGFRKWMDGWMEIREVSLRSGGEPCLLDGTSSALL